MRKIAFLITVAVVIVFLASCAGRDGAVFPSGDVDYTMTVDSGGRSLKLAVRRRDGRTEARIVSPEELSSVSVLIENGAASVVSRSCVIPLSDVSSSGIRALFDAADRLAGSPPDGTGAYSFDLTDGGIVRHCEITDPVSVQK